MSDDDKLYDYWLKRLKTWHELRPHFETETTFKEKFGVLLKGRYDDVVMGYRDLSADDKQDPPWLRRRVKRHLQHREKALLLLADQPFTDDLFAVVRKWKLDNRHYWVDPLAFWDRRLSGMWCWANQLFVLSLKFYSRNYQRYQNRKLDLAAKFCEDFDLKALRDGMKRCSMFRVRDLFYDDLHGLCERHGLSPLWWRSVEALLLSGTLPIPFDNCEWILRRDPDARLFIEVFPETRKEDIADLWAASQEMLSEAFPDRPERRRRRQNLARDLTTKRHRDRGKAFAEIVDKIHDLDATMPTAQPSEVFHEERRLERVLEAGFHRLRSGQHDAAAGPTSPVAPEWVRFVETIKGAEDKEWYLPPDF